MVKLLFWGVVAFVAYLYFSQKGLDKGTSKNDTLDDDEDYMTIKIPKKKTKKSDDEFSDYEEVD